MSRLTCQCQVCGLVVDQEIVEALASQESDYWIIQNIDRKGGPVKILTCPDCDLLTDDMIFEAYCERIRQGLVEGFH